MASAVAAAGRPAPNTAAASTASRMPGNANRMSRPEEIIASTAPRRQAATTASSVPAVMARSTTASGPSIEVVAPASSRDSTSRPWPSKPSRCPPTGPTQASDKLVSTGLYGASSEPKNAANMPITITPADARPAGPVARSRPRMPVPGGRTSASAISTVAPMASLTVPTSPGLESPCSESPCFESLGPASQRDPRVEHRVQQVDDEVDHHERGHQHQRDALHHGQVLGLGRLDQVGAQPVQAERRLDHRVERDEGGDRDAGDRGDRDGGVAQDVPPDPLPDRDAPADRGLHVLTAGLGADRGPGHPGHDGQRRNGQGD